MEKLYKCCKNKELKIYCCKACLGIFHDSCVARRKGATILEGHIIYCSKECQSEENSDKDGKPKMDCKEEEKLKKLKELYDEKIKILRKENAENDAYIKELKEKISEFNNIKNNMLESIKILTLDNEVYTQEISKLKSELTNYYNKLNETKQNTDSNNSSSSNNDLGVKTKKKAKEEAKKQRKILILCDETGRGIGAKIKECLKCQVETIIKPGALFENVIEGIKKLTEGYTVNDYVLIICGSNNFKNKMYPRISEIHKKIKFCTHTNILLSTIPQFSFHTKINNFVKKFNSRFLEYVIKLDRYAEGNIRLIDILDSKGNLVNREKICEKIINEIMFGKKVSNLTFICVNNDSRFVDISREEQSGSRDIDESLNDSNFFLNLIFPGVEEL